MIYIFTYPDIGVIQEKVLISHDDYLRIKEIKDPDEYKAELKKLTKGMEWFTDKSPLYEAIFTGILNCNGIYKCIVKTNNLCKR